MALTKNTNLVVVLQRFYSEYQQSTSGRLKLIDAYLFYVLLTGIVQFVYCCLVGTFPFNSFLAGFISCVASFVLAGELRNLSGVLRMTRTVFAGMVVIIVDDVGLLIATDEHSTHSWRYVIRTGGVVNDP